MLPFIKTTFANYLENILGKQVILGLCIQLLFTIHRITMCKWITSGLLSGNFLPSWIIDADKQTRSISKLFLFTYLDVELKGKIVFILIFNVNSYHSGRYFWISGVLCKGKKHITLITELQHPSVYSQVFIIWWGRGLSSSLSIIQKCKICLAH